MFSGSHDKDFNETHRCTLISVAFSLTYVKVFFSVVCAVFVVQMYFAFFFFFFLSNRKYAGFTISIVSLS